MTDDVDESNVIKVEFRKRPAEQTDTLPAIANCGDVFVYTSEEHGVTLTARQAVIVARNLLLAAAAALEAK